jgi:uncharacterized membrane protein YoaK (UPF0700 family)
VPEPVAAPGNQPIQNWPVADLFLLTIAAGMMDALTYLHARVFAANMTGNAVILGLGLAGLRQYKAVFSGLSIAGFAAGAWTVGWALVGRHQGNEWSRDVNLGLAIEIPFVLVFALLTWLSSEPAHGWMRLALIASASWAMGMQSVAVRRLKIKGVVTTFITGTLTAGIAELVAKERAGRSGERSSPLAILGLFAVYILAAAVAGLLDSRYRALAAAVPLAAVAAVRVHSFFR